MNEARFYCPDLAPGAVTLSKTETRHALVSLRLRPGDALTLFDGRGHIARGRLEAEQARAASAGRGPARGAASPDTGKPRLRRGLPMAPGGIGASHTGKRLRRLPVAPGGRARVAVEHVETVPLPRRTLTLIVPGCKGSRLTWMVEKLTELGVTRIVLAEFERSVVHAGETHVEKLRRTAIEACKQCGRAWLPEIESRIALRSAVALARADKLLVADPDEQAPPLGSWLHQHTECENLAAVIGPEGGLTPDELEVLKAAGGHPVRLADHILRVETAAVAAVANWGAHARAQA